MREKLANEDFREPALSRKAFTNPASIDILSVTTTFHKRDRKGVTYMDVKFPIGQMEVPEQVTNEDVKKWLNEINSYTTRLREVVDSLDDEDLNKTYREGSWTVRQLVHHIADSQLSLYHRLKMALTEYQPTVSEFDQDKWAYLPDNRLPVESSIRMLEGLNERIVALGNYVTGTQLDRIFIHETDGEVRVSETLEKLSWHEEHHLAHIRIALGMDL